MKLFQHEGKVLRFKAKFAKPKPEVSEQKSAAKNPLESLDPTSAEFEWRMDNVMTPVPHNMEK